MRTEEASSSEIALELKKKNQTPTTPPFPPPHPLKKQIFFIDGLS